MEKVFGDLGLYKGLNIASSFIDTSIMKSHVKQHERKTKSGKLVNVKEHNDKRNKKANKEDSFLKKDVKEIKNALEFFIKENKESFEKFKTKANNSGRKKTENELKLFFARKNGTEFEDTAFNFLFGENGEASAKNFDRVNKAISKFEDIVEETDTKNSITQKSMQKFGVNNPERPETVDDMIKEYKINFFDLHKSLEKVMGIDREGAYDFEDPPEYVIEGGSENMKMSYDRKKKKFKVTVDGERIPVSNKSDAYVNLLIFAGTNGKVSNYLEKKKGIDKSFTDNDIEKSDVKAHARKSKSGKLENVKQYSDKRKKKVVSAQQNQKQNNQEQQDQNQQPSMHQHIDKELKDLDYMLGKYKHIIDPTKAEQRLKQLKDAKRKIEDIGDEVKMNKDKEVLPEGHKRVSFIVKPKDKTKSKSPNVDERKAVKKTLDEHNKNAKALLGRGGKNSEVKGLLDRLSDWEDSWRESEGMDDNAAMEQLKKFGKRIQELKTTIESKEQGKKSDFQKKKDNGDFENEASKKRIEDKKKKDMLKKHNKNTNKEKDKKFKIGSEDQKEAIKDAQTFLKKHGRDGASMVKEPSELARYISQNLSVNGKLTNFHKEHGEEAKKLINRLTGKDFDQNKKNGTWDSTPNDLKVNKEESDSSLVKKQERASRSGDREKWRKINAQRAKKYNG